MGQTKAIDDDFGCVCIKICFSAAMKTEPKQISFQTNGFQEVEHVLKQQDYLMIETYNMFPNIIDISVMSLYESQSEIVSVFFYFFILFEYNLFCKEWNSCPYKLLSCWFLQGVLPLNYSFSLSSSVFKGLQILFFAFPSIYFGNWDRLTKLLAIYSHQHPGFLCQTNNFG